MSKHYDEDDDGDELDVAAIRKDSLERGTLRSVAVFQKAILVCILIYLGLVVAQIFLPSDVRWLAGIIVIILGLTATVFVFLLATKVYHPAVGVLLALLTLIPCVGLIVLLIINGKATTVLRAHGISVGLLGADVSQI